MKYNELVWAGQHMVFSGSYRCTWVDSPRPQGGDTVSMGSLGMVYAGKYQDGDFLEVPVTAWGDYCGDGCARSNYRSLLRDYPETFVEVRGDYHSQYLAIRKEDLTKDLDEIFTGLVEQYPLYDDEDHSELETEEATEQYDSYLRADILRDLAKLGVDTDAIDTEELDRKFWEWMSNQNEYPYLEDAVTIYFPNVESFVEEYTSND